MTDLCNENERNLHSFMKTYNIAEFIENFLIPDLKTMADLHLHYYAFAVMCQATELLGSIFDSNALDENGLSEKRFQCALVNLYKDDRYRAWQSVFFKFFTRTPDSSIKARKRIHSCVF